MFNKITKDKKKVAKEMANFQEEQRISFLKWQIENRCIVQPIIRPMTDRIQASLALIEATDEQINQKELELDLAERDNK